MVEWEINKALGRCCGTDRPIELKRNISPLWLKPTKAFKEEIIAEIIGSKTTRRLLLLEKQTAIT